MENNRYEHDSDVPINFDNLENQKNLLLESNKYSFSQSNTEKAPQKPQKEPKNSLVASTIIMSMAFVISFSLFCFVLTREIGTQSITLSPEAELESDVKDDVPYFEKTIYIKENSASLRFLSRSLGSTSSRGTV